jgi:transcriptional regulator
VAVDTRSSEVVQGTLDLLVLKVLSLGSNHGWGISQRLQQLSRARFQVNQGSLYPALQRLARRGWVESHWGISENNRRARFYRLTREGERQLDAETESWSIFRAAVEHVHAATAG